MQTRTLRIAFMVVVAAGMLSPRLGFADEPNDAMTEGRKHFLAGVNLIEDPDGARYEEAYHAFQKAFALTKSPKVLGNIGLCSMKLERDGEAIDAYASYLRQSTDIDPSERAQIERDLNTLSSTVGVVRVTVANTGNYVLTDTRLQSRGAPVLNAYSFQGSEITLRLRPGQHSLKLKAGDSESAPWDITIEPSTRATHVLKLIAPTAATAAAPAATQAAPPAGPSYVGPVLLGVLGAVGVGGGVVTGLLSRSREQEIADNCPNGLCPSDFELKSTRTEAKTFATVADVSMIAGGAVLATAIVWALVLPRGKTQPPRTGSITWSGPLGGSF